MYKSLKKILPFLIAGIACYLLFLYLSPNQTDKQSEFKSNSQALNLDIPNPSTQSIEEDKIKLYKRNSFESSLSFEDSLTNNLIPEQSLEIEDEQPTEQASDSNNKSRNPKISRTKKRKSENGKKIVITNEKENTKKNAQLENDLFNSRNQTQKKKKTFSSYLLSQEKQEKEKEKEKFTLNQCHVAVIGTQFVDKRGEQIRVILIQDAKIGDRFFPKGKIMFANTVSLQRGLGFTLYIDAKENGVQKRMKLIGYSADDRIFFPINGNYTPVFELNEETKSLSKSLIKETIINDIPLNSIGVLKKNNKQDKIQITKGLVIYFKKRS